jgi:hypothetical protein
MKEYGNDDEMSSALQTMWARYMEVQTRKEAWSWKNEMYWEGLKVSTVFHVVSTILCALVSY